MEDGFEATFVVELGPDEVFETLTSRRAEREAEPESAVHYVLPGFPSMPPLSVQGASCTQLEVEPSRLLRVRKDDQPCAGTEIAVTLEALDKGTRVTIVQSNGGRYDSRRRSPDRSVASAAVRRSSRGLRW